MKTGRLNGLAGFGPKSEERILHGIEVYRQGHERVLLDQALEVQGLRRGNRLRADQDIYPYPPFDWG